MQICSRCHTQSLDTTQICPNCESDLSIWSESTVALKRLQENPRVSYVRISVSDDCCPTCRQMEGAYAKDSVPRLPVEGCSHARGCRCFYQPVLEFIYP